MDYAWDAPKLGVPETWRWLEAKPLSNAHVVDGRCNFDSSDSPEGTYRGGSLTVSSVTYADLNGDGRDDAVVDLLFSTGGTAKWHYVYVFTLQNEKLKLLARPESGSRADGGLTKVSVIRGMLVLDFADTRRRVADCCSAGYVRIAYRWHGDHFVESGNRQFGDLDLLPC